MVSLEFSYPLDRPLRRRSRGQSLVEFALLFPVLMLMVAGLIDGSRLMVMKADQNVRTALVAAYASEHDDESWHSVANDQLPGCEVTVDRSSPHGVVVAGATCHFEPLALHGLWAGLEVSSEEPGYAHLGEPEPTSSPTPNPSPSEVLP